MGNKTSQPALVASTQPTPWQQGQQFLTAARKKITEGLDTKAGADYEASIKAFQQALLECTSTEETKALKHTLGEVQIEYAKWCERQGNPTKARELLQAAQALNPETKAVLQASAAPPQVAEEEDELLTTLVWSELLTPLTDKTDSETKGGIKSETKKPASKKATWPTVFKMNPASTEAKSSSLSTTQDLCRLFNTSTDKAKTTYHQQALEVIALWAKNPVKHMDALFEVAELGAINDPAILKALLQQFTQTLRDEPLLNPAVLDGLARAIHLANPAYLDADDLVQILMIVKARHEKIFLAKAELKPSLEKSCALLEAFARLLDAMVDSGVKGLYRETYHAPLYQLLESLTKNKHDKSLKYRAAYAIQALVRVGDDETRYRAVLRHALNLGKGVGALAGAVKGLDVSKLKDAYQHFSDFTEGVGEGLGLLRTAATELSQATQKLDTTKLTQGVTQVDAARKHLASPASWYDKLRFAELLVEAEHFTALEAVIKESSATSLDLGFMWGCVRLLGTRIQSHPEERIRQGCLLLLTQLLLSAKIWDERSSLKASVADKLTSLSRHTRFGRVVKETTFWGDYAHLQIEMLGVLIKATQNSREAVRSTSHTLLVLVRQQAYPELAALCQRIIPFSRLNQLIQASPEPENQLSYALMQAVLNPEGQRIEKKLDTALEQLSLPKQVERLLAEERQRVLSLDAQFTERMGMDLGKELQLYIPPQAKPAIESGVILDLKAEFEDFLTSNQRVLLLLGSSGAGKSLFGAYATHDYWKRYQSAKDIIPLFIPLTGEADPEHDLIEKTLRRLGFNTQHIAYLKQHHRFVFILDGYDEIRGTHNLIHSNRLLEWQAKISISCRTEYLAQTPDYALRFIPQSEEKRLAREGLRERHMAPFSQDQIKAYLKQYVALRDGREASQKESKRSAQESKGDTSGSKQATTESKRNSPASTQNAPWPSNQYWLYLGRFPGLLEMVQSPYLLFIMAEALPSLVAQYGEEQDFAKLTRAALYKRFLTQWFDRQIGKLIKQQQLDSLAKLGKSPQEVLQVYAEKLAAAMQRAGVSVIEYIPRTATTQSRSGYWLSWFGSETNTSNMWDEFFKEDPLTETIRLACPLVKIGAHRYRFVHDSLREYLAVGDGFNKTMAEIKFVERQKIRAKQEHAKLQLAQKESVESKNTESKTEEKTLIKEAKEESLTPRLQRFFAGSDLNARLLNDTPPAIRFHADLVKLHPDYQAVLLDVVKATRIVPELTIAGANAITILNAAEVSFSNLDLSGVRIAGADLSGSICDSTNFSRADLQGVNFQGAWLRATDFSQAKMNKVRFGEWPYLQFKTVVQACAYSSDDCWLAVGVRNEVHVYDMASHQRVQRWVGHTGYVTSVAWDAKGKRLASGSWDHSVRLWEVESGRELRCLKGHTDVVHNVAWDATGERLASGSSDHTVRLWGVQSGWELLCLQGHTKDVTSVAWDAKGERLASGSHDHTVRVWETGSGRELQCLKGQIGVMSVAWDAKSERLASGGWDKNVRLWEVESGRELRCLKGHMNTVTSVAWDAKGERLASGSWDDTVRVWEAASGRELQCLQGHTKDVTSVAWDAKGERLASGDLDGYVRLWEIASSRELRCLKGHMNTVTSVAWDAKGEQLASGSWDYTVRVWEVSSGRELRCLKGHTNLVMSVAWDNKGERLASGSQDKTVRVWEVGSGRELRCLKGHTDNVSSVSWDGKGERLASGAWDRTVRVWEVGSGRELHCLKGHTGWVTSVSWDSNDERLASGSWDYTVRVWEVESGRELRCLKGHTESVTSVAWDAKGERLASGDLDGYVRLWEIASSRELRFLQGHTKDVTSVAWDAKGERLASGSRDHTVRLWEAATGQELFCLTLPRTVNHLAFYSRGACELLAIAFGHAVACFELKKQEKNLWLQLKWLNAPGAMLYLDSVMIADATGLSATNHALLQQRGAKGMPATAVTKIEKTASTSSVGASRFSLFSSTSTPESQTLFQAIKAGQYSGFTYHQDKPLLQSALPNTTTPIKFEEFESKADGNCGFYSLGVSRTEAETLLMSLAQDAPSRQKLAPEIINEIKGGTLEGINNETAQALAKRWQEIIAQIPTLETKINTEISRQQPSVARMGYDNPQLITHLENDSEHYPSYKPLLAELKQHRAQYAEITNAIQAFCETPAVYTRYVQHLGKTGWLGTQSALLIAQQKQYSLYVWHKTSASSNQLSCINYHQSSTSRQTIHLLHTDGFTHFNLLAEANLEAKKSLQKEAKQSATAVGLGV